METPCFDNGIRDEYWYYGSLLQRMGYFFDFILLCILIYPHEFQYYLWKQHAPRLYQDHVNVSIYFGAPFVDFDVNHCLIHEYFFSF